MSMSPFNVAICIFNCYSTLIRRRKRNVETTSIFRRRSDVDYYTSKQRRYLNVETTSLSQRRFHLCFQPLFDVDSTTCSDVVSTSFRRRFAGWVVSYYLVSYYLLPCFPITYYRVSLLPITLFPVTDLPCFLLPSFL